MTTEILIALIATFVAILAGLSSIANGLSSRRKLIIEDGSYKGALDRDIQHLKNGN